MNIDYSQCFHNKSVLITGGLGFVGANLCKKLVELGANVTIVDSLIPEYGGNLYNVREFRDNVELNISDVRDEHSMKYLVQDMEYLFNLAGQTSHMDSMVDPYTDLEINCRAQLSILEACRQNNPDIRVVFASTRQFYGKPDYLPVDEKHLLRPVDVNGINKMAGEWYHHVYNNVYGVRSTAIRMTNTYGPCMRVKDARQTFVGVWIRLILESEPFEVWGGEQLRDFTYIDDAVNAFLLSACSDKAVGKIYNLGGAEYINLRDLAEMLISANGSGKYMLRDFPDDRKKIDIGDYYSDFELIRSELGWQPVTDISQGLQQTLSYFRNNLQYYL